MKFNAVLMTLDQNTKIRLVVTMYGMKLPGDRIMIRIHRQYNKSPFPTTEGGEN